MYCLKFNFPLRAASGPLASVCAKPSRATPELAVPPFPPTRTSAAVHVSALRAWAHAGWRYMESGLHCGHVATAFVNLERQGPIHVRYVSVSFGIDGYLYARAHTVGEILVD